VENQYLTSSHAFSQTSIARSALIFRDLLRELGRTDSRGFTRSMDGAVWPGAEGGKHGDLAARRQRRPETATSPAGARLLPRLASVNPVTSMKRGSIQAWEED